MSCARTPAQCCMFGVLRTHATWSAACAIRAGVMCMAQQSTAVPCGALDWACLSRYRSLDSLPQIRIGTSSARPHAMPDMTYDEFATLLKAAVRESGLDHREAGRLHQSLHNFKLDSG